MRSGNSQVIQYLSFAYAHGVQVIKVDEERGAIVVHGCVPGKPGNVLEITPAKIVGQNWKYQR